MASVLDKYDTKTSTPPPKEVMVTAGEVYNDYLKKHPEIKDSYKVFFGNPANAKLCEQFKATAAANKEKYAKDFAAWAAIPCNQDAAKDIISKKEAEKVARKKSKSKTEEEVEVVPEATDNNKKKKMAPTIIPDPSEFPLDMEKIKKLVEDKNRKFEEKMKQIVKEQQETTIRYLQELSKKVEESVERTNKRFHPSS
jgi:hypothetical protein